jgi:hypothetical protein
VQRRYAERTSVPVARSREEIEKLLARSGAKGFIYGHTETEAMIGFEMNGFRLRFMLPLAVKTRGMTENAIAAETRRRWRAFVLVLKAKLEAVASRIVIFEREFMPYIVTGRGGETVGDQILADLPNLLATGKLPPLLGPGPG